MIIPLFEVKRMRLLQHINSLLSENGIPICGKLTRLGNGENTNGEAYYTGDNRVVKTTNSTAEFDGAMKISKHLDDGNSLNHFPTIYAVFDSSSFLQEESFDYVILKSYARRDRSILSNENKVYNAAGEMGYHLGDVIFKRISGRIDDTAWESLRNGIIYNCAVPERWILDLFSLVDECRILGMVNPDICAENLGYNSDGDLILIDW